MRLEATVLKLIPGAAWSGAKFKSKPSIKKFFRIQNGKHRKQASPEKSTFRLTQFYRQRAHANPFSDHDLVYSAIPKDFDWAPFYPSMPGPVEYLDIGCGYGGLLMALSKKFPQIKMLGMEIRLKVQDYVHQKIIALRANSNNQDYNNISVMRMNSMKFAANFITKAQLKKIFILFADPHFKKRKNKHRIITSGLIAEYAYFLKPNEGILYTVTDVKELHEWQVRHLDAHPLFKRMTDAELEGDICIESVMKDTEEGKKVERNGGDKYMAVYRRIESESVGWSGFALDKDELDLQGQDLEGDEE